ncbi:MAG: zinc/manganese transport system ATP-binding protein [Actinomycetota bacterium]|nr:zinc/manganese transport system ATP-binding protein [Actinomycetota bacterium]
MSTHTTDVSDAVLTVRDVGVWLSGREILSHVDFSVRPGEFVGLIGSNGAGKTTLLRLILGLLRPTSGRVTIAGIRGRRRAGVIGYLPQKVGLDADVPLRARDVVALGLDGQRLGIPIRSNQQGEAVEEILAAVGGLGFADKRIGQLSGGQQQRILLAHALISSPRLLLLDEPLANLDPASTHDIVTLLGDVCAQRGVAIVLTAHDMNPLLPVMDRIVYLAGGKAAVGTTDEVARTEVLTKLYGRPIQVIRAEGRVLVVAGDTPDSATPAAGPLLSAQSSHDHPLHGQDRA